MPEYRLFPLALDGRVGKALEMVAFADVAAMRWAMRASFPHGCDVWIDSRFVGRVHGPAPAVMEAGPQAKLAPSPRRPAGRRKRHRAAGLREPS